VLGTTSRSHAVQRSTASTASMLVPDISPM